MRDLTLREARELLAEYAEMIRTRDERVLAALDAGLSVTECAALLEVTRSTVYRIMDGRPVTGNDIPE